MEYIEIAPGIISFNNIIDNPKQFIDDVESTIELNRLEWYQATQSDGSKNSGNEIVKSARNCYALSIPKYDQIEESNCFGPLYEIHKFLNNNLNPYFESYCGMHNAPHWKNNEGWQLLKYGVDNYFINHYDDSKQYPRTMSMSFYLNDDYEGGEIEFTRFNIKIKPKANQAIFFPANYVYNHTVHPVKSGMRYAVVAWWE